MLIWVLTLDILWCTTHFRSMNVCPLIIIVFQSHLLHLNALQNCIVVHFLISVACPSSVWTSGVYVFSVQDKPVVKVWCLLCGAKYKPSIFFFRKVTLLRPDIQERSQDNSSFDSSTLKESIAIMQTLLWRMGQGTSSQIHDSSLHHCVGKPESGNAGCGSTWHPGFSSWHHCTTATELVFFPQSHTLTWIENWQLNEVIIIPSLIE